MIVNIILQDRAPEACLRSREPDHVNINDSPHKVRAKLARIMLQCYRVRTAGLIQRGGGWGRSLELIMASFIIIEDDLEFRYLLKAMLKGLGHELICAVDNIASALTFLKAGKVPDIILLDVVLPGGSGVNIIEHVRTNHKDTKIVMTTGLSEEYVLKIVPPGGYDAILQKPFTAEQMAEIIGSLLKSSAAKLQPPPAAGAPENTGI